MVKDSAPFFAKLLFQNDEEVLCDALWGLSYLSDGPDENVRAVVECGIVPKLVSIVSKEGSTQVPALRTLGKKAKNKANILVRFSQPFSLSIGNILTGDNQVTQITIDAGGLKAIIPLIFSPKKGLLKEVFWYSSELPSPSFC
jgi:hypothetical protein